MSTNIRSAGFQQALSVLNFRQDIKDHFKEQNFANVGKLVRMSDRDIADLKDESGGIFKLGHGKTINIVKKLITDYLSNHNNVLPHDCTTEFNTD